MNLFTITFDDDSDEESSYTSSNSDKTTIPKPRPPTSIISRGSPPRGRRPVPKPVKCSDNQNANVDSKTQQPANVRPIKSRPVPTNVYKYIPTAQQKSNLKTETAQSQKIQSSKPQYSTSESYEYQTYSEEESETLEEAHSIQNANDQQLPIINPSNIETPKPLQTPPVNSVQQEEISNTQNINPIIFSQPEFTSYRVNRMKSVSLRGQRTHFQLYQSGTPLLHSKIKSQKSKGTIYISEGTSLHFKDSQYKGALIYGNNCSTFSLRHQNDFGEEIMTIKYQPGINGAPRSVFLGFPNRTNNLPQYLSSRHSHLNESNEWVLDMHGKFTMNSIKNCVIVDENDHEYAFIMKVEKSILGVEVTEQFTELMAFALAISAFICKIQ